MAIENSTLEITPAVHVNVRTTLRLLHPQALERSLFMAHDELKVVGELNADDIRLHSDRCVITNWYVHFFKSYLNDRLLICNSQISALFWYK